MWGLGGGKKNQEKKGCRRRGNMKDVRIEQGSERRETEGQLLSFFIAILLISALFFFSPKNLLRVPYKTS